MSYLFLQIVQSDSEQYLNPVRNLNLNPNPNFNLIMNSNSQSLLHQHILYDKCLVFSLQ